MTSHFAGDVDKFRTYQNVLFQPPLFNCAQSEKCLCCIVHDAVADDSEALDFALRRSDAGEDTHHLAVPIKELRCLRKNDAPIFR